MINSHSLRYMVWVTIRRLSPSITKLKAGGDLMFSRLEPTPILRCMERADGSEPDMASGWWQHLKLYRLNKRLN